MKRYAVRTAGLVAVAAIMVAGSAFAGRTPAERERALPQGVDSGSGPGLQGRPAQETGNLPMGNAKQLKSEGGTRTAVPTIELGGMVYRIGIDTP